MVNLWATFALVWPTGLLKFPKTFWTPGRTILSEISLFSGVVGQNPDFRNFTLAHFELSHSELFTNITISLKSSVFL